MAIVKRIRDRNLKHKVGPHAINPKEPRSINPTTGRSEPVSNVSAVPKYHKVPTSRPINPPAAQSSTQQVQELGEEIERLKNRITSLEAERNEALETNKIIVHQLEAAVQERDDALDDLQAELDKEDVLTNDIEVTTVKTLKKQGDLGIMKCAAKVDGRQPIDLTIRLPASQVMQLVASSKGRDHANQKSQKRNFRKKVRFSIEEGIDQNDG